jgi:biopolymer transport protein ExbD
MHVGDGGGGQDFDLNLAPIIDCFTVLITYLLVSASFLSLSIFDVGVAASGASSTPNPKTPPHTITLQMHESKTIDIRVNGGAENLALVIPIAGRGSEWDLTATSTKLEDLKQRYSDITDISLTAENHVIYKEIVRAIESLRKTNPKIFLAS